MDDDPYSLQRFVDAQAPVYEQVVAELRAGRKRSHWMWFIFPQIQGLGHSEMALRYAISSLDEAKACAIVERKLHLTAGFSGSGAPCFLLSS